MGAGLALLVRGTRNKLSGALLGVAGGIVLALVLLDMLPDAYEEGGAWAVFLGAVAGAGVLWFLQRRSRHSHHAHDVDEKEAHELATEPLIRAGMLLAAGMAVHNFPQGIAVGSGLYSSGLAALSALLFAHNIPEGMAMAIPLKVGGVGGRRIMWVAVMTAIPTILGALVGVAVAQISEFFIAVCLAFASGAMLFLTISELVPHSASLGGPVRTAVSMAAGLVAGGLLTWLFH